MTDTQQQVIPQWTMGWRLQRALAHAGISVEQIAYELGVSRSTISRWLNDRGTPSRGYLQLWALRTGVSHDWLVDESTNTRSKAIPTGIEHQPPSTAEIKAIRRRIPLRAPTSVQVADTRTQRAEEAQRDGGKESGWSYSLGLPASAGLGERGHYLHRLEPLLRLVAA